MERGKSLALLSIISLILFSSFIFATHVITTSSGASSYSVNEDVSFNYNITVNNTDLGQTANITQVDITLPSSFSFLANSNDTDSPSTIFTNTSAVLSWTNSTNFVVNESDVRNFWFNATASTPGNFNLTITTTNSTGSFSSNISVTINDTTIPSSISFVSPTSSNNSNTSQSYIPINITAIDNGVISTIIIKLFNSTNDQINSSSNSSSPSQFLANFTGLSDGVYYFNSTVNDTFGNSNSTSTRKITLDALAPNVFGFNNPVSNANLSGTQVINATANDTTLTISSVFFNITNSSGQISFLATSQTGDNWNATLNTSALTDGNYNITVYANDTVGNLNNSEKISVTIDNTFPTLTSLSVSGVFNNGTINISSPANQDGLYDNLTIDLAYSETVSASIFVINSTGSVVKTIYSISSVQNPTAKGWDGTLTGGANASDGFYTINTTFTDEANNTNTTQVASVYVDNTAPSVTITSPKSNENFTKDQSVLLLGAVSDLNVAQSLVFNVSNSTFSSTYTTEKNLWFNNSFDITKLADGFYNVTAIANDTLGNLNKTEKVLILVDSTDPTITNLNIAPSTINNDNNVTLNATINDSFSGISRVWVSSNFTGSFVNYTISGSGQNYSFLIKSGNFSNQEVVGYQWFTNDTLGNEVNSSLQKFNISNRVPVFVSTAITNATEDKVYTYQVNTTDSDGDSLTYSLTTSPTGMGITSSTGLIVWLPDNSQVGNSTVSVLVNDSKGGTATQTFAVNVTNANDIPTTPSLTSPSNQSTLLKNSTTLKWNVSTDDDNNTITYYVFFSNETSPSINATTTNPNLTVSGLEDNETYYWNVIASDGIGNSSTTATLQFNISLNNAPNITAHAPLLNKTISENQTLMFNATIFDVDGDNIIYNWTIDNVQNSSATTSTSNETIFFNYTPSFSDSGTHTIKLSIKDTNNNSGTAKSWLVTVSNDNRDPTLNTIIDYSVNEDSTLTFDITGSDPDEGDTLTYDSNLSSISITKVNNTLARVSWTPTNSDVGANAVNFTLSDGTKTVSQVATITIVNTNDAPTITSSSPSSDPIVKNKTAQTFSVSTSDADSDSLSITWYVNGSSNGTGSSFSLTKTISENSEVFNITVFVSDGTETDSKEWKLIVTSIPVTSSFTGSGTTDFSTIPDLSSATDIVLAESDGKIDFGNEILDLSNVLDLDNNIKILEGIVAINSSRYPQLNKPATITLTGLSYSTAPKVFSNSDFTTSSSEITSECSFCKITNFTKAPTSSGTVIFEVEHFSSFKVAASGNKLDLNSFDDLDLCEEGIIGDLELEIKDPDERDDFKIGDLIKIKVDVENSADEDQDVIVEASLYNIDEDDEMENDESNDEEINEDDNEIFNLEIEVPDDFDDGDDYLIYVKAYEEKNEDEQCDEKIVEIKLEREKHDVIIKDMEITPLTIRSGKNLNVFVDIENIGSSDEDVYVTLKNDALEIFEKSETFELEEQGEDDFFTQGFFVRIPDNTLEGEYSLIIEAVFDGEEDTRTETISVLRSLSLISTDFDGEIINLKYGEKTETIKIEKEGYLKKVSSSSKEKDYLFVVALALGILILLLLIAVILSSRRIFR